jgi:hypothetical protein
MTKDHRQGIAQRWGAQRDTVKHLRYLFDRDNLAKRRSAHPGRTQSLRILFFHISIHLR